MKYYNFQKNYPILRGISQELKIILEECLAGGTI